MAKWFTNTFDINVNRKYIVCMVTVALYIKTRKMTSSYESNGV